MSSPYTENDYKELKNHINELLNYNYNKFASHLYDLAVKKMDTRVSFDSIKFQAETVINLFIKNKQLYKNHENSKDSEHFSIYEQDKLEAVYDGYIRLEHRSRVAKYAKSFVRSYKHLLNDESYELFSALMEKEIDRKAIAQELRKIASYDTSEKLNTALSRVLEQYKTGLNDLLEKIMNQENEGANLDVDLLQNKDGKVALKINDFDASEALGANQWCISTDESYFGEYLNAPDRSFEYAGKDGEDVDEENENEFEGFHVFYYDFNRTEDDPLSKIAFTISANGRVSAAHDKNDDEILDEIYSIVPEKDIAEFAKKGISFISEEKLDSLIKDDKCLETGWYLVQNTRHPLNVFMKALEKREKELLEDLEQFIIRSEVIDRAYSDYFMYDELSPDEFINDMLGYAQFIDRINERFSVEIEMSHGDIYSDMFEFQSEEPLDYNEDLVFDINVESKDIFREERFGLIFKELSDIKKRIIFENNIEVLKNLLNSNIVRMEGGFGNSDISKPKSHNLKFSESFLIEASSFMLSKNIELTEKERDCLIFNQVSYSNYNENINDMFIERINSGGIHIDNVIRNLSHYKNGTFIKLKDYINENPEILKDVEVSDTLFVKLLENHSFLSELNKEAKNNLTKSLERSLSDITDMRFREENDFSFGINIVKSIHAGFVSSKIIDKINTSRISFGSQDALKEYAGEDYKGFKETLKELTEKNEIKQTKKSRLKP